MTRTPLMLRTLPAYSRAEECANMVTHIVGGGFGVLALVAAVLIGAFHRDVWSVVGGAVFGGSMVALYTVSGVYHGLHAGIGKKVMQVIDHCTIYLLIAGTYTPILLSGIRPAFPVLAWTVFGVEWGLAAFGAVFTAIDHNRYKILSMIGYLGMGWCIVLAWKPAVQAVGAAGFWWLLAGGIAYTVGAVLYLIGGKRPIFHTVFHVFVVLGSILQAVCILLYVL